MVDEHIHKFDPIGEWYDPTGEAPYSNEERRLLQCNVEGCEETAEESRPKES